MYKNTELKQISWCQQLLNFISRCLYFMTGPKFIVPILGIVQKRKFRTGDSHERRDSRRDKVRYQVCTTNIPDLRKTDLQSFVTELLFVSVDLWTINFGTYFDFLNEHY